MKTVGIIAEYNPFHSGHAYQIRRAIELSGADYVIAVMSPDFVQRGSLALIDKWTRARMALSAGVSLVLELPVCYASSSAEYFAEGGVSLLSSLGCVDFLSFGCESADLSILENAADFFADAAENGEPQEYRKLLQSKVKAGMPYPKARAEAYLAYLSGSPDFPQKIPGSRISFRSIASGDEEIDEGIAAARQLSLPNNILAIEYLKALRKFHSDIEPLPIMRLGEGYHSVSQGSPVMGRITSDTSRADTGRITVETGSFADRGSYLSAESIRSLLHCGKALPEGALPEVSRSLLLQARADHALLFDEDLDRLLQMRLCELASQEKDADLTEYLDVTGDLANRIRKNFDRYESFDQFVSLLKTRDMTETRIRRSLTHILLGIRTEKVESFRAFCPAKYARILGFRKDAAPLLRQIRTHSQLPLVANVPDAMHISARTGEGMLDQEARTMLNETLYSSRIYNLALQYKTGRRMVSEYRRQHVIL